MTPIRLIAALALLIVVIALIIESQPRRRGRMIRGNFRPDLLMEVS